MQPHTSTSHQPKKDIPDEFKYATRVSALYQYLPLDQKLNAIWSMALEITHEAEEKHAKQIRKYWKLHAFDDIPVWSVTRKGSAVRKKTLGPQPNHKSDHLANAYEKLLVTCSDIQNQNIKRLENKNSYPIQIGGLSDEEFFKDLISKPFLTDEDFLNKVLPYFFVLQLHCLELQRLLSMHPNARKDKSALREDAQKGGLTSNRGQDELRQMYLKQIQQMIHDGSPCKLDKFYNKHQDLFYRTLIKFQADFIHLPYATIMTSDGIARKFKEWAGTYPDFRKALEDAGVLVPPLKAGLTHE